MTDPTANLLALSMLLTDAADKARRDQAAERLRVWGGDAEWLITRRPYEDPAHFESKKKFCPNLTRMALGEICQLYRSEPYRESERAEEWDARLWSYADGLTPVLAEALPLAKLCGQVEALVVRLDYPTQPRELGSEPDSIRDGELDEPPEPGCVVRLFTPDQAIALACEGDPRYAEAVALCTREERMSDGRTIRTWEYWDDEYWGLMVDQGTGQGFSWVGVDDGMGNDVPVVEHHRGCLPVVSLRWQQSARLRTYWADAWGGKDLLTNLGTMLTAWTEYLVVAMLQRGQPYVCGSPPKGGGLGPDSLLEFAPGDTFGIASNSADLSGIREAVMSAMELFSKSLGLPTRAFRVDRSEMSGIALSIERSELEDERKRDAVVWSRHEDAIARVTAKVLRDDVSGALEPWAVTFKPISTPESPADTLARVRYEREQVVMSRLELKRTLHPELGEEECQAAIDSADEDAKAVAEEAQAMALDAAKATAEAQADATVRVEEAKAKATAASDPLAALLGPTR